MVKSGRDNIVRKFCIAVLIVLGSVVYAQRDNSWLDAYPSGIIDWSQYIQLVPAYMGPYALPVPPIYDGRIQDEAEVSGGYTYYSHQEGEATTHSANTRFYYPVAKGRVAVELTLMPHESFSYSDEMADEMHTFSTSGSGTGDLYINTYVQLFKQSEKRPDVTLRYGIKTASGSHINNARHTNSPGYYMDIAFGKDVFSDHQQSLRFYGLAGFYAWQLLDYSNMQNDAFLYGLGAAYRYKDWKLKWDFGGFYGYKMEGDKPLVMRMQFDAPISEQFKLRFMYEKGISDFPYNGYHAKLVYHFTGKW